MSYYGAVRSLPDQPNSLSSADIALEVRQHPQHALVTPENKEKTRKPIDPPPIVQLKVNGDRHRNWLVNPFLFMNAVLVSAENEHGQPSVPKTLQGNQLLGQNVSSLHRLKDINNKDGGFFVFGDISCRKVGMYRLQFNLFNYERDEVNFLGSAVSQPFRVMTAKEYPGLQESTHLSRTFSDQGVRLRLRKENRNGGVKRTYTAASEISDPHEARPTSSMYSGGPVHNYSYEQPDRAHVKRQRSDSEYTSLHAYPAYASGAMPQYSMPGQSMYTQHQPHPQHPEHQQQVGSMMTPMQQSMMANWQRSPAPYSTPAGGGMGPSGGSYFSSGASAGQIPQRQDYAQQTSPQYGGRGSNDVYAGMASSLPTPVSEQGLGSTQPSMAGYGQPGQMSASLPSRGQPVQQYDLAHPSSQYAPQPVTYAPHGQSYQAPAPNPMYEQHPAPNKHEDAGYGDPPTMYSTPAQNAYAGAESFSAADNPLSTGMLNREFSGAYQQQPQSTPQQQEPGEGGGYAEMPPGQDLSQYQQPKSQPQPAAYPTPQHQTSPTQLRDHG